MEEAKAKGEVVSHLRAQEKRGGRVGWFCGRELRLASAGRGRNESTETKLRYEELSLMKKEEVRSFPLLLSFLLLRKNHNLTLLFPLQHVRLYPDYKYQPQRRSVAFVDPHSTFPASRPFPPLPSSEASPDTNPFTLSLSSSAPNSTGRNVSAKDPRYPRSRNSSYAQSSTEQSVHEESLNQLYPPGTTLMIQGWNGVGSYNSEASSLSFLVHFLVVFKVKTRVAFSSKFFRLISSIPSFFSTDPKQLQPPIDAFRSPQRRSLRGNSTCRPSSPPLLPRPPTTSSNLDPRPTISQYTIPISPPPNTAPTKTTSSTLAYPSPQPRQPRRTILNLLSSLAPPPPPASTPLPVPSNRPRIQFITQRHGVCWSLASSTSRIRFPRPSTSPSRPGSRGSVIWLKREDGVRGAREAGRTNGRRKRAEWGDGWKAGESSVGAGSSEVPSWGGRRVELDATTEERERIWNVNLKEERENLRWILRLSGNGGARGRVALSFSNSGTPERLLRSLRLLSS